jgi:hypothetical protein
VTLSNTWSPSRRASIKICFGSKLTTAPCG